MQPYDLLLYGEMNRTVYGYKYRWTGVNSRIYEFIKSFKFGTIIDCTFGESLIPCSTPQLNPIYPEGQLHSKPSGLLSGVQVPPFRQGSGKHGSPIE